MQHADPQSQTVVTVYLDVETIEKAELLGLDLSEMANKFLLAEVTRLQQTPGYGESQTLPHP